MATQVQLQNRVRDKVFGAYPTDRPYFSTLGASYTSAPATITVLDGTKWATGDVLENRSTSEQFYVISVASNVLTVLSGFNGTTEAASTGTDDLVSKNPRFSTQQIDDALTSSLKTLNNWGIHGFGSGSQTRDDAQKDFWELSETDLDPVYGVLEVYEVEANTLQPRPLPFRYRANLGTDPTDYTTGVGILVLDYGEVSLTEDFYYTYAQVYDAVTEPAEGEEEELLVLGAVVLLLGSTIVPATQDPGARTNRTVAPGQTSRDVRAFQAEYFSRAHTQAAKVSIQRGKFTPSTVRSNRARRWRN